MTKLFFTPEQITKMNLKADADQASVETAFENLVAKAARVDGLEIAKKKAEDDLKEFETKAASEKIENLVATALTEKKITVELGNALKKDYAANPAGLETLLKAMPAYQSIVKDLKADADTELGKMTWEQLDKANKLEDLKAKNIEMFKEKYKQQFGTEYK